MVARTFALDYRPCGTRLCARPVDLPCEAAGRNRSAVVRRSSLSLGGGRRRCAPPTKGVVRVYRDDGVRGRTVLKIGNPNNVETHFSGFPAAGATGADLLHMIRRTIAASCSPNTRKRAERSGQTVDRSSVEGYWRRGGHPSFDQVSGDGGAVLLANALAEGVSGVLDALVAQEAGHFGGDPLAPGAPSTGWANPCGRQVPQFRRQAGASTGLGHEAPTALRKPMSRAESRTFRMTQPTACCAGEGPVPGGSGLQRCADRGGRTRNARNARRSAVGGSTGRGI